jgi:hypothetical protein
MKTNKAVFAEEIFLKAHDNMVRTVMEQTSKEILERRLKQPHSQKQTLSKNIEQDDEPTEAAAVSQRKNKLQ